MATDRLKLYNGALGFFIGERSLASLSENREPRRLLDNAWDGGAVRYCLEQGLWNFAMRTIRLDYSPSVEPDFGYRHAFNKPEDWVRTASLCTDEYFNCPLLQYSDEAGYWFSDLDVIYVRYVSDDSGYGNNLSLWPETFTQWVQAYLASLICKRITQNKGDADALKKEAARLLADARAKDAMNEPAKFLPPGGWSAARHRGQRLERWK